MVNYLNGGNGFPFDLKPQFVSKELEEVYRMIKGYNDELEKVVKKLREELEFCRGASSQLLDATENGYPD